MSSDYREKRKPNWSLCVKDDDDSKWRTIGAAWETEKGHLFLKLDDGETLRGIAMLFPYRERNKGGWLKPPPPRQRATPSPKASPPPTEGDYMERQRRERQNPPQPPPAQQVTSDFPESDPREPDWL